MPKGSDDRSPAVAKGSRHFRTSVNISCHIQIRNTLVELSVGFLLIFELNRVSTFTKISILYEESSNRDSMILDNRKLKSIQYSIPTNGVRILCPKAAQTI